jgi:hypothetical protein
MFDTAALLELGRKLAGTDVTLADDGALKDAALTLETFRRFLDAAETQVLAELEQRGCCDRDDGCSTATWLAREAQLPHGVARQRVRIGAALRRRLPRTGEALAEARIGIDHARVLVDAAYPRIADQIAEIDDVLLQAAQGCTFDRWRREVQGLADLLDQDGGYDPTTDPDANRLGFATTGGTTALRGTLVGHAAAVTIETIDRVADELLRTFTADAALEPSLAVPSRAALRALALSEICRRAAAVDLGSSRPPRPEATYVIRAEDPYQRASTPRGTTLQDGTTRVLRCAEDLRAVIVDSLGAVLDLGHRVPHLPPAQRRAVEARDGGCVFPGCEQPPAWCDAHHLDERRAGGRTDLRRMALLCRHHHVVTHRAGWTMGATDDQWFWWDSPSGNRIWSQRHGRRRDRPPE